MNPRQRVSPTGHLALHSHRQWPLRQSWPCSGMRPRNHSSRKALPHWTPAAMGNRSILVFVTQCTARRRQLLAREGVLPLLIEAWQRADFWQVGRFVVMPDHIHLFCQPTRFAGGSLKEWMTRWRSQVTRKWLWNFEKPIWQRDFFDRQLRVGESYSSKWEYIRENPVRAGLCSHRDEWPWQGEVTSIEWHAP